ncbi:MULTISPECIES: hypothetical protein [unclassified Streptomyces]|uniref:Amino acid ABC transporter permease n=1 Tax=Streptomyces sp. NBC_00119 TaxID=2975659 RepID=A0AAU1U5P5_9ACTN|nr:MULTISPECIES: hypothetical protein [unclassified Streptomyces]MCX4642798.1 hypothetical protein [Streptomyces sp. NBC_01446]MCX5323923.1 hypothetical protein [Streptomyces sp. NBC_00120]
MAWDEWEQLKTEAAGRQSTHMQLNRLPDDEGGGNATPSQYGDLAVGHSDLEKVGSDAHKLYSQMWDKARVAVPTTDSAATDLTKQGFALGAGLQTVSNRWEEQLKSLMDATAQISNHMHVTRKLHAGDDGYIERLMSSIDTLDAGFDERVGEPGKKNSVYGAPKDKKDD